MTFTQRLRANQQLFRRRIPLLNKIGLQEVRWKRRRKSRSRKPECQLLVSSHQGYWHPMSEKGHGWSGSSFDDVVRAYEEDR